MTYDQWKTTEDDDWPTCESHGYIKPCRLCKQEAAEVHADAMHDELIDKRLEDEP